ncbi:hypothetical protein AVEN_186038-1 [Araneus ventricosus]|uniref:Uncharacterized protein n=1 Tax=Araneus ventricosus TaxID=182803 RepID=A0A4Y2ISE5_ARAVE|nr:hypothetical protein AVEN_3665-1 [Araneus ventricosus]GBM80620.1 hypothetical protein AVEN_186038-1 [Araneus ventricosus]
MSGISVEEYFTADDDLMVFEAEITDEMENDDEEVDDTHTPQSLLTSLYRRQSEVAPVGEWGDQALPLVGEKFCTPFTQRGIQLIDK